MLNHHVIPETIILFINDLAIKIMHKKRKDTDCLTCGRAQEELNSSSKPLHSKYYYFFIPLSRYGNSQGK